MVNLILSPIRLINQLLFQIFAAIVKDNNKFLFWCMTHYQPYFHLDGYMNRVWIMPKFTLTLDENGYLHPKKWMPFSIRLHYIRRQDIGNCLHDHPANYRTIILSGYYWELDIKGNFHKRLAGFTKRAKATNYHRITNVSAGGVYTLFIMTKHYNKWGFLVDGKKVLAKDHFPTESN